MEVVLLCATKDWSRAIKELTRLIEDAEEGKPASNSDVICGLLWYVEAKFCRSNRSAGVAGLRLIYVARDNRPMSAVLVVVLLLFCCKSLIQVPTRPPYPAYTLPFLPVAALARGATRSWAFSAKASRMPSEQPASSPAAHYRTCDKVQA